MKQKVKAHQVVLSLIKHFWLWQRVAIPKWEMITPFGLPVEPDVKTINAMLFRKTYLDEFSKPSFSWKFDDMFIFDNFVYKIRKE